MVEGGDDEIDYKDADITDISVYCWCLKDSKDKQGQTVER